MRLNFRMEHSGLSEEMAKEGHQEWLAEKNATEEGDRREYGSPFERYVVDGFVNREIDHFWHEINYIDSGDLAGIFSQIEFIVGFLERHDPSGEAMDRLGPRLYSLVECQIRRDLDRDTEVDAGKTLGCYHRLFKLTGTMPARVDPYNQSIFFHVASNPILPIFSRLSRQANYLEAEQNLEQKFSATNLTGAQLMREVYGPNPDMERLTVINKKSVLDFLENPYHYERSLIGAGLIREAYGLRPQFSEEEKAKIQEQFRSYLAEGIFENVLKKADDYGSNQYRAARRIDALEAAVRLQNASGLNPERLPGEKEMHELYDDLLTGKRFAESVRLSYSYTKPDEEFFSRMERIISALEKNTGVAAKFSPEAVQQAADRELNIFLSCFDPRDYRTQTAGLEGKFRQYVEWIRKFGKADFNSAVFSPAELQKAYDRLLRSLDWDAVVSTWKPDFHNFGKGAEVIESLSGDRRTFSPQATREFYIRLITGLVFKSVLPDAASIESAIAKCQDAGLGNLELDANFLTTVWQNGLQAFYNDSPKERNDFNPNQLRNIRIMQALTKAVPNFVEIQTDIQKTYVALISQPTGGDSNNVSETIKQLSDMTGVLPGPETQSAVQKTFRKVLLETVGRSDFGFKQKIIESLMGATGAKLDLPAADLQEICAVLINKGSQFGALRVLRFVAGNNMVGQDFEKLRPAITEFYHKNILIQEWSLLGSQLTAELHEISGIPVEYEHDKVQQIYQAALKQNPVGFIDKLMHIKKVTGILPDYASMLDAIYEVCNRTLKEGNLSMLRKIVSDCAMLVPDKPMFDPETAQMVYRHIIQNPQGISSVHFSWWEQLRGFVELTGVAPDFRGMEEAVQKRYNRAVAACAAPNALRPLRTEGLIGMIEAVKTMTNIPPQFEIPLVYSLYVRILESGNMGSFKELVETIGVQPEFHNMTEQIQEAYNRPIAAGSAGELRTVIENLEAISGMRPVFDLAVLRERYSKLLQYGEAKEIKREIKGFEEITKAATDFTQFREVVQDRFQELSRSGDFIAYLAAVSDVAGGGFWSGAGLVERLYKKTCDFTEISAVTDLEQRTGVPPPREVVDVFLEKALASNNLKNIEALFDITIRLNYAQDWAEIFARLRGMVPHDIRSLAQVSLAVNSLVPKYGPAREAAEVGRRDAWFSAVQRILNIQGLSENLENDPWKQELEPLLQQAFGKKTLTLESAADPEILVKFIEQTGMVNLPKLFELHAICARAENMEQISSQSAELLEEAGIRLKRPDGSWRFTSPALVLNEVNRITKVFQSDLLSDRLPEAVDTELGREVVARLKGKTQWERSDSLGDLISTWRKTVKAKPILAVPPEGFQEARFAVALMQKQQAPVVERDPEALLQQILHSKMAAQMYLPLAETFSAALRANDPRARWQEVKKQYLVGLEARIKDIEKYLDATFEQWQEWIGAEADEKNRVLLGKKQRALASPQGRIGFEKQLEDLQTIQTRLAAIVLPEDNVRTEAGLVAAMHSLSDITMGGEKVQLLRELSALHMVGTMPEAWQEETKQNFAGDFSANVARVGFLAKFARDYIFEHYLHEKQEPAHTGHSPLAVGLRKELTVAWQQQMEGKKLPLELLNDKIRDIVDGKTEVGEDRLLVSMIPTNGLFRILSGDIGDACFTSKHQELASGGFPNLHAWIYVTNRGKPNEALRGSLLGIETEDSEGAPVLLARANNPRENFIKSVEARSFVQQSLLEVVNAARRIREIRVRANSQLSDAKKRQRVVVALDERGRSSTNRQDVANAYFALFKQNRKIPLKRQPETEFNGYQNWKESGGSPSVVIWEMDEQGNETWHGDWQPEK